jgi:hypothetical protein
MNHSSSIPHPSCAAEHRLILPGLDGTNPLGYLAALGLFRVLSETPGGPALRLQWTALGGTWVPVLENSAERIFDEEVLLSTLNERLANNIENHPANLLTEFEAVSRDEDSWRRLFKEVANRDVPGRTEWISAFASDFASPDSINQLQTVRRDYFYGNLMSVIHRNTREHLRRAIFHAWDYADALDNQSLHLDPSEDRRHAHQWSKPAGDPERKTRGGMLGANRLALEAIPMFPSFPEADTLRTVGFTGTRSTNTRWTWPIWRVGISLPVVRSLLSLQTLQEAFFDSDQIELLRAQGIVAAYRTRRILVGKTPNFTPAERVA